VAFFRVLLAVFGVSVTILAVRYMTTGERRYLTWAARLMGLFLVLGVVFFVVLLIARLV